MNFDADYTMTINGKAVSSGKLFDVVNPATGEVFAKAPDCSREQLDEAVNAARFAFKTWRKVPIDERQATLRKAADVVLQNSDALARLFVQEQGRPYEGALMEVQGAAQYLQAIAELSPPEHVVEDSDVQLVKTHYVPLGVVCAISPWNFPVSLSVTKIGPAILAGNTVVLKPSPYTPLCTLKIAELFRDVFPPGVVNVITGGDDLGPWMTAHAGFDKITFTGSTSTGKRVMAAAASDLKRITLELGGNDASIVLQDVNVAEIAPQVFFGAFFNTSQVCIATKRLYVHEDVYDALRDQLLAIAKASKVGPGAEQGTVFGPIQNKRQYERVMELLKEAKESGLTLLQGADVPKNGGYFVPLTIVDNPPEDSRVVREEAFGPILPMMKFTSVEEVIARVNDTPYGLGGSVWSKDIDKATEVAEQIDTGTVWINQTLAYNPMAQFSGRKQSGFGVEGGIEGLLEFMAPQTLMIKRG